MRLRKLLAMFLTLSMLVSLVPTAAFATETGSEPSGEAEVPAVVNPNNLFLDKTATLENDGTYTIDLEAYATGTPITKTIEEGKPLDVVLVIDQSGSLHNQNESTPLHALKSSVTTFVEKLKANGEAFGVNHRIAICGFASNEKDGTSGTELNGYSYAGTDHDNAWVNTGLFVEGAFKDYATMEYIRVEKVDEIDASKYYSVKCDPDGNGIYEIARTFIHEGEWIVYSNTGEMYHAIAEATTDEQGNEITANENLFNNYEVYTLGNSTNQLTDADYTASWEYIADGANGQGKLNADVIKAIDSLAANGATRTYYGLKMAARMMANVPYDGVERKRVVIVFTDGKPGYSGKNPGDMEAVLSEAKKIKENGVEIYTVGVYKASDADIVDSFMNQLSSNYTSHAFSEDTSTVENVLEYRYGSCMDGTHTISIPYFYKVENEDGTADYWPIRVSYVNGSGYYYYWYITDEGEVLLYEGESTTMDGLYTINSTVSDDSDADYYKYSSNIVDLPDIFQDVVADATTYTTKTELSAEAILKDVMADGFQLTDNTTITVSVVPGSVSEENKGLTEEQLTSDKITWGEAQQVLSFAYPTATTGKGTVTVGEETIMSLTAQASEDGVVTVSGFDYANQFIGFGRDGYKLVVSITGVEADANIATGALVETNLGTSGIYEGAESDADEDGTTGEIQAAFPIPTTYLTSKTYYLDYTGKMTFNPADFLMTVEGVNADIDGYHYFGEPGTTVYTEYGKITVNADGTITYELVGSDWEHNDVFYLFGTTEDPTVKGATANANGNMWSKITIVPPEDIRGKLYVDKTATLTDNGTYTIDLEAYATGTPIITSITEGIPLDVVLVIDQSGSLHTNGGKYDGVPLQMLKESVTEFVETLKANGEAYGVNHRISMCGFASGELQGASGTTDGGYSYASDMRYNTWVNTGLFVDGEFREYAKMNYIRINNASELDVNRYYTVKFDPYADGNYEYVRSWYYSGHTTYRYWNGQKNLIVVNGEKEDDTKELLMKSYEVYKLGKSTVQLKDDDYAASWENLASGENGQGSINPHILKSIDKLAANGATNTFYGLKMASRMLENAPDDGVQRKKVVIVFTDGEPGYGGIVKGDADAALSDVMKIKETGAEVYAVGVYSSASEDKVNTFMNHLSSNYKSHSFTTAPTRIDMSQVKEDTTGNTRLATNIDTGKNGISPYFVKVGDDYWPVVISTNYETPGVYYASYITDRAEEGGVLIGYGAWDKIPEIVGDVYMLAEPEVNRDRVTDYYKYSGDINELSAMFQEIATDATTFSSQVSLDANAILKDVMADGFKLTDNTTITVSVVPGSVSEENKNLAADELTKDKITWGEAQQVLTFAYPAATTGSGKVVVNGAADQTEMKIAAMVDGNGVITVTGYNYADPADNYKNDAQYISYGHPGSKLVVTITGVEAEKDIVTDSITTTNKGTSGIYEGPESDIDGDGEKGEMQASFPIPTTYLTSKTYYLDYTGSITIDPDDFLMTVKGVNADADGYHYFGTPGTTVETEYGEVTVNADGSITYTLTKNNWENPDTFYLFGTTGDPTVTGASANVNGNMWSKITIIPPEDIRGNLYVDKKATLEDNGTYTIDLEAYATGTPVTTSIIDGIPLDVVLVLDQSGSLFSGDGGGSLETLKNSVTSFIETLKTNGEAFGVNHRVSICGFASAAKQGASGVKHYGLSYANDIQDNAWINTGLFVNGQFKDYGTLEYIPVESVDDIVSDRYYAVEHDFDKDGIMEISRAYVRNGAWVVSSGTPSGTQYITLAGVTKDADGNVTATANENLFNNYKVYTVGGSSNLLTDADYAASWENVADGLNGQGNINPDITKTIDSLAASGATATFYGLKMAARMLANVPDDGIERKRVVIVFTDGVPGYNGYTQGDGDAALSEVMKIKETDAEVYAVGIYKASSAASVETFMNQLSSNYVSHSFTTEPIQMDMAKAGTGSTFLKYSRNIDGSYYGISPYFHKVVNDDGTEDFWPISVYYDTTVDKNLYHAAYITDDAEIEIASGKMNEIPGKVGDVYMLAEPVVNEHPDADYYKYSSTIDDLSAIFKAITTDATTFASETALGVDAVLKDVMASNFVLTDNTTVTVSVVPGSISKENEDLPVDQLTSDKITWGQAQQVLTFNYPEVKEGTGTVVVNGAADQTEMTLTAKVDENGVITVTGFNYANPLDDDKINAQFIGVDHPGSKLLVTITGVEATSDVVTDGVTATNQGTSGIYEPEDSDADEDGEKGEIQASFPIPTTYLTSKVYVVDYAKPMTIDPADFKMTEAAESLDADGYNYFNPAITAITETYGKVAVADGKITYKPTNTNWDGFDTFYVFGTTNDATIKAATANTNGNMWSKVSVIPANNVYYEDTFVTNEDTGTVGIVYTGAWTEDGTSGNQGENAETGESTAVDEDNDVYDQGGVHGWEDTLADDTGYSDGSAHKVSYDKNNSATATFTFTGTGVDIYSRTNKETGIVIAMLYEGDSTTDENGKNLTAKYTLMVDNLAASGDYYQIPTLSLCQVPAKDGDGNTIKDEDGNTVMTDLPYGTYTVKIIVSKASDSQTGSERFIYYLDGIRVYNPIQNQEGNDIVSGAYGEDELNATFVEIRDKLLDANSFSAEDEESAGFVFIDRITSEEGDHTDNTETWEIGEYKVFGPENEVYLSANQMIAFAVEYREGAHYYIGMKSLTDEPAGVMVNTVGGFANISIGHTTDLYYEVLPEWEYDEEGNPTTGIIFIMTDLLNGDYAMDENGEYIVDENGDLNYEGAILALTKLKVTGPSATTFTFARVRNADLLSYAEKVSDTAAPDVEIENPESENPNPETPENDWQTITQKLMLQMIKRIFGSLSSWFDR